MYSRTRLSRSVGVRILFNCKIYKRCISFTSFITYLTTDKSALINLHDLSHRYSRRRWKKKKKTNVRKCVVHAFQGCGHRSRRKRDINNTMMMCNKYEIVIIIIIIAYTDYTSIGYACITILWPNVNKTKTPMRDDRPFGFHQKFILHNNM